MSVSHAVMLRCAKAWMQIPYVLRMIRATERDFVGLWHESVSLPIRMVGAK